MAFKDRDVDQKVCLENAFTDLNLHAIAVTADDRIFLRIDQRNVILFGQGPVSAVFKSFTRFITDPGTFQDEKIMKAFFLEIGKDAGYYFRMGGSAIACRRRAYQIWLDPDTRVKRIRSAFCEDDLF